MDKKLFFKVLFWFLFATVLVTTLMPLDGIEPVITFDFIDKVIHFIYFFGLAVTLLLAYPWLKTDLAALYLIILGFMIEVLQHTLPTNRSFDLYDALFDTMGVIAGILLMTVFMSGKLKI